MWSFPFTTTLSTTLLIKLDRDNFLLWKSQVLPIARGHGIEGCLFGTKPQPPEFLESQDEDEYNVRIINPEFEQWNREDQLLLSWLLCSKQVAFINYQYAMAGCFVSKEDLEIHALLLNQESRIEQLYATNSNSHHLSSNFAAYKNGGNHGHGKGNLNHRGRGKKRNEEWMRTFTSFSTSSNNNYKATVYMATPDIMIDPSWYADSGATNHVTVEMNNLRLKKPYEGHEKLMIGNDFCSACQYCKSHVLPFPSSKTKTAAPLELIHSDIWGASLVNSATGYRHYIHFLDDYTRLPTPILPHDSPFQKLFGYTPARDMIRPSADLLPVASGIQSGLPQPTQTPLLDVHTSPTSQPFMSLSAHAPTPCHPMIIGAKADIFKPKVYVSVKHPLSFSLGPIEPMCVKQTLVDPNWKRAIEEEYKALRRNRTWELVPY
ncbi:hypothetical protein CK203_100968 [Vitis vinifera]|uniref:Retrovirus-related Pol polyprotein from transposon RE1 n=1 Tax=Vitis vinifera TaxID=29760 RepID=A0A438D2G9_VITVI|nr:hypothetical protein CK203_100968 [Vitis vinifera]